MFGRLTRQDVVAARVVVIVPNHDDVGVQVLEGELVERPALVVSVGPDERQAWEVPFERSEKPRCCGRVGDVCRFDARC